MTVADEAGFKAGSAYLDLDVRDQTPEGIRRVKERIERGDHVNLPVGIDEPNLESFQDRLIAAVKSIKPQVTVTLGDPVTPKWKQETDEKTRQYSPPPVKTEATNPIDAAWRAQLNASVRATAAEALKIPANADTAKFRTDLRAQLDEISKTANAKIPADLADADAFKAKAEALAREVSATVQARIPVEIDRDKADADARKAGEDIGRGFSSAFGNGIAPMPALIGAAVLAGAPIVGAGMVGIVGAGMAGAAAAITAGSPDVFGAWQGLSDKLSNRADALRPRLSEPIADALTEIGRRFDVLAPQVENDLISAERAVKPLTDGLLGLAQNALPGVTLAISTQTPVITGFRDLLEDTGTSVGDMFTQFSRHSIQFGTDVRSLDSILQSAMSFLTNLITQAGDAWAANSGQIDDGIHRLFDGFSQLSGAVLPALTSELANVLSVLGLLAQGIGAVEHMLGPLGSDLTALALTAKILGVNLSAIPSQLSQLPGKLAEVAEGSGRFAGLAGVLGGALPIVGTGLGIVAAGFGAVALGASMAAQHEQDLIDTGTQLGHSIDVGGTAASDAAKKLNDMEDQTNKLKVQIQQLGAQQEASTRSSYTMNGGFSATTAKSQELQSQLQDLNTQLKAATDAENNYKQELGPLGLAQARAAQAQKDYNDAISKYGAGSAEAESAAKKLATANAEVTSQQQNLNNAMSLTKASMGTFERPAVQLQADLAKIGDQASTDEQKITAMKDALVRLSGGAIPVGDAMEAIDKAMSTINDKMTSGIVASDGYGKALLNADGSVRTITKNGQFLRDTMTDLRGKFVDAAAAIVAQDEAQGKSAEDAKKHAQTVLEQQVPAIEKLGEKMGLTKDQVDNALKSMGAWPADLVTTVATPGVQQAQQAMDILKGKVLDVPNDHTVHTQALTDQAIQALRDLGLVVTTLPDGTVTITGNTSLAYQAAQTLVRDINGMHATVTVDARGNTSSVHFTATGSTMSAHGNLLYPMEGGGVLSPMSGALATMVEPDSWRVVGDNMTVPELFAPLDGSQRTRSFIQQAAEHEGIQLPNGKTVTVNVTQHISPQDPQAAADAALAGVAFVVGSVR